MIIPVGDFLGGGLKNTLILEHTVYGEISHALVKYWDWILPKSTPIHKYIVVTDIYRTSFIIINTRVYSPTGYPAPVILGGPGPGETYLMAGSSTGSKK